MMNIEIKINKLTRMVYLSKNIIGNDAENLQANLVFSFEDEFVDGQARLEYKIDGNKYWATMEKIEETYVIPTKSVMTKEGKIEMQLVITEGIVENETPIFKSNVFYMLCGESINSELEEPAQYPEWIDIANSKLNRVDNLNITAVREEKKAVITVTRQDGSQDIVDVYDGNGGGGGSSVTKEYVDSQDKLYFDKTLDELARPQHDTMIVTAMQEGIAFKSDYTASEIKRHADGGGVVILRFNAPDGTGEQSYNYETFKDNYAIFRRTVLYKPTDLIKRIIIQIDNKYNVTKVEEEIQVATSQDLANANDEINYLTEEVSRLDQSIGLINTEQALQNSAIEKNSTGIQDLKNAKPILLAEYQKTTYEEVQNALKEGKVVFLKNGSDYLNFDGINEDSSYVFSRIIQGSKFSIILKSNNQWASELKSLVHPLSLTGAVNAKYDGSEPIVVDIPAGGVTDNTMSDTSENAVQNKVIKKYIDDKFAAIGVAEGGSF